MGYGSVLRARVFQPNGTLAADTARHGMSAGVVQLRRKRNRDVRGHFRETIISWLNATTALFFNQAPMPIIRERPLMTASDIPDVMQALNGKLRRNVVQNRKGHMVLSVAVPVQDLRVVRGALLLTQAAVISKVKFAKCNGHFCRFLLLSFSSQLRLPYIWHVLLRHLSQNWQMRLTSYAKAIMINL